MPPSNKDCGVYIVVDVYTVFVDGVKTRRGDESDEWESRRIHDLAYSELKMYRIDSSRIDYVCEFDIDTDDSRRIVVDFIWQKVPVDVVARTYVFFGVYYGHTLKCNVSLIYKR